jgi:uncharacterized protein (TIGR02679 family)
VIRDEKRLRAILEGAVLARLMEQMTRRLRLGRPLAGTVSLKNPTEEERQAVDRLLGRRPSVGNPLVVRLEELQARLVQAEVCDSLEEGVRLLAGEVVNEKAMRAARVEAWGLVRRELEERIALLQGYQAWFEKVFKSGDLKKKAKGDARAGRELMGQAVSVLEALPAKWPALAKFAAQMTGDSHALDAGTALSALCLGAIAESQGVPFKASAGARRRLWSSVGVVVDELSSPVLTLNIRADAGTQVGALLAALMGEPCYLTVRQLRRMQGSWFAGMDEVYVCENPSVVAEAAGALGARCKPVVCTAGQPASAAQMLLALLKEAGCRLRYHGDIDPAGVAITNLMVKRFGVTPWRMGSADYLAGVGGKRSGFKGRVVAASWDEALAGHLSAHKRSLLEESVMELLMKDLEGVRDQ